MAENQQPPGEPPTPPTGLPALPAGTPPAPLPPGLDADEYRRFQEFQRFQDYQRFTQGQPGNLPAPAPHHHELATHLADMRQQLARIEKVTNPPTWQKVLRNKWLHRLAWLIVLIVLATWGVPTLIHHYFGSSQTNNPAALHPGSVPGSGKLYNNPKDAVAEFYHVIEGGPPGNVTACEVLTNTGQAAFARDLGVATCADAIQEVFGKLGTDGQAAYSQVSVPDSAVLQTGNTAQVSSCGMQINTDPRLGLFLLTQNPTGDWQVTGHRSEPNPCPAASTTTGGASAPPTS
jgi:hypothetical protein